MFYKTLNFPFLSPDNGASGGGYELDQEQLDGLDLDFGEEEGAEPESQEPDENEAPDNSEVDTPEAGGEQTPATINIPGIGEVSIDELNEWRGGGLRQSDYTKKTQELASQRKQMEEEFGVYRQLDSMFASNPQLEQAFIKMIQEQGGAESPDNGQQETNAPQFDPTRHPMFQQMNQQLQQQQTMFQQWQEQQHKQAIDTEWNGLFTKFPDAKDTKDALAKFVDEYNTNNNSRIGLEAGYMLMNFENVRKQTQQEMVKNNMKKKPANTVRPQNNATTEPADKHIPEGNYESLVRHLMKKDINL